MEETKITIFKKKLFLDHGFSDDEGNEDILHICKP